ncbi:predicted protein [Verticillium alfalfae VaMs.102]|uniref:peptidylprolyl isomerase n=1 Tax=Verticillium alfalfae (strain VaMs.102 / ATCC MYA-4576 / FGSC 10136) TaxID=526221 RepID=C9SQT5_VERA1|nr:predicted protein [Verticillium alfalfae VaMs.102]EEY21210.1 predicted protein [Verticillium alfalfae VaMs.102]
MQGALLSFGLLASTAFSFAAAEGLKIDKTLEVECERKTVKGDRISVHYRGSLQDGGKEFDASYNRGQPFNVKIGAGQVIKGYVPHQDVVESATIDTRIARRHKICTFCNRESHQRAAAAPPVRPGHWRAWQQPVIGRGQQRNLDVHYMCVTRVAG